MIAYYYCSYNTFCSMLESKSLWLTDLTKSNDSQEVTRLYREIWDDIKVRLLQSDLENDVVSFVIQQIECARDPQIYFDVPYGCCFSFENDLVQQWREYGDKGCGVSVGFDLDWFNIQKQFPITSARISAAIGYEAVRYDSKNIREELFSYFYHAIKQEGMSAWILSILPTIKHYAGFIKNPSFRDEKEIRILFYPSDYCEESLSGLSGLQENIRPHYCLNWADETSNAIRSVTVGYNCNHTPAEIADLIQGANLSFSNRITVCKSECSYRDRIT